MKSFKRWLPALFVMIIVMSGGVIAAHAVEGDDNTIFEGVYVNSVNVGAMTEEEADEIISEYVQTLLSETIVLTMGEETIEVLPEEIGLQWANTTVAKDAYNVGRCGNLIKRFKEQKDLERDCVDLRLVFVADEELLTTYLTDKQGEVNSEAVNNGLKRENGEFIYVEGHAGVVMDVEASVERLKEFFAEEYAVETLSVELVSIVDEPQGSKEELAKVKDVLGSFTTDYSTSAWGRCRNVEIGTERINGSVIYPGETFSVYESAGPVTQENGYELAGAYENGMVVESYGGGICQVSTTLYNAVILSELDIVERYNHTMIVSYVEPSMDAAIAGTYFDLKFTNNTEYPIYIEGITKNKKLTFNIYGVETRSANRTIQFVSEITETVEAENEFREVDQPIGVVNRIQGAYTGYDARLWKVVYENGKEVSREVFNSSHYNPASAIYEVGMTSSHPEAVAAMKEAIATGDIDKVKEAAAYWCDEAIAAREGAGSTTPPTTPTTPITPPTTPTDPSTGEDEGDGDGEDNGENETTP